MKTIQRIGLFLLFLMCGYAIFVFGSGYFNLFPTNNNPFYLAGLSATFLVVAIILKRDIRLEKYWRSVFAFFTASAAQQSVQPTWGTHRVISAFVWLSAFSVSAASPRSHPKRLTQAVGPHNRPQR